jgi:hypothetical protein
MNQSEPLSAPAPRKTKSTSGPRTNVEKHWASKKAVRESLIANGRVALSAGDQAEIAERFDAWAPELAPTGHRVAMDLVMLASVSFQRTFNAYRSETADAASRVRQAGDKWDVERQRDVMNNVAKLDESPMVAVAALKTSVAGIDWMLREFRVIKAALDNGLWEAKFHLRARKLLGFDNESPNITNCLPDIWNTHLEKYAHMHRVIDKPLFDFPWQRKQLEINQFEKRWKLELERYDKLYENAKIYDKLYTEFLEKQIAELEALREKLLEKEAIDRAEAAQRALFESSDTTRLRLRHITDSQRDFYRALKEIRDLQDREHDNAELFEQPVTHHGSSTTDHPS